MREQTEPMIENPIHRRGAQHEEGAQNFFSAPPLRPLRLGGEKILGRVLLPMIVACLISIGIAQQPLARPLIIGVAHIAFQVSDIAKARDYYGGLLGYEEPFQIINPDRSLALTYFKVNDRQYIEIFPGLPACAKFGHSSICAS